MLLDLNKIKKSFLVFLLLFSFLTTLTLWAEEKNDKQNVFLDSDQDGLSDAEEISYGTDPRKADTDGDGYSDGTEISTGYDPLKPAPGDKIVSENSEKEVARADENLTKEISAKIAGTVTVGEGNGREMTMEDINNIIEESIGDQLTFADLPEIDKKDIKIKKQNYKKKNREEKIRKDDMEYLTAVSYLLISGLPYQISEPEDAEDFSKEVSRKISSLSLASTTGDALQFFDKIAKKSKQSLKSLEKMEVPENMVDIHIKGLQLLKYAISLEENNTVDHSDPIKSIIALGKAQNLLVLSVDFVNEIDQKLKELNISLSEIEI